MNLQLHPGLFSPKLGPSPDWHHDSIRGIFFVCAPHSRASSAAYSVRTLCRANPARAFHLCGGADVAEI